MEYRIFWDDERDFGQIWPRPSASEVQIFYDVGEYYTHELQPSSDKESLDVQQRLLTKLAWLVDHGIEPDMQWWSQVLGKNKLDILDIGCGSAPNIRLLEALGHRVVGVEPDAKALKLARISGHEVYAGTAEALPAEVESMEFDVVIFMHVLEDCVSPAIALKNAMQILKIGGYIVAEFSNNACTGAREFGSCWYWLDAPRHLNSFTSRSLSALLTEGGVRQIQLFFRGYCRQFSAAWRNSQNIIARNLFKPDTKKEFLFYT